MKPVVQANAVNYLYITLLSLIFNQLCASKPLNLVVPCIQRLVTCIYRLTLCIACYFRFWHKADRLKRCEVCYQRKVDTRIALIGVRYFKVGRLLNTLPRFANDFLTILFGKCSFLTFRNDTQNQLRRTAKFSSHWHHYNRTVNQNRMLQH